MEADISRIGKTIAEIRRKKGRTQRDISNQTGLTVTCISMIETGQRMPSFASLVKIAKVLNIPFPVLFIFTVQNAKGKMRRIQELACNIISEEPT